MLQARIAKRNKKEKRIRTVHDNVDSHGSGKPGQKRKPSNFTTDLTDTSRKGAKRMRYDANVRQKEIQTGKVRNKGDFTNKKGGMANNKKGGENRKFPNKQGGARNNNKGGDNKSFSNKKGGGINKKGGDKRGKRAFGGKNRR